MKRALKIVPIVLGILVVVYIVFRILVPPTNVAETSPAHLDGALRTRYYSANIDAVDKALTDGIPQMTTSIWGGNWKVVEKDADEQSDKVKVIKAEIPVVFFIDDMKITLRASDGRTAVDIWSGSRVGKSDFGENRRHVSQVYEMLDSKFGVGK